MNIIVKQSDNSVHIHHLTGEVSYGDYVSRFLVGEVYETIDPSNSILPPDDLFRDAWSWQGTGSNVVEELEPSRTIALAYVKSVASKAVLAAQKSELLTESTSYSTTQIRDAYLSCKQTITNAADVSEIRNCLVTYETTYGGA